MSSPYAAPPDKTEVIPPNRATSNAPRALALWLVLVVAMVALYNLAQPPAGSRSTPEVPTSSKTSGRRVPFPVPFALPLLTAAVCVAAFFRLRARLPASLRTGELKRLEAPKPEPTASTPFEPVVMNGRDAKSPLQLTIDAAGLHYHRAARALQPEQHLDVSWDELQGLSFGTQSSPLTVWGMAGGITGALWTKEHFAAGLALAAIGIVLLAIGLRRGGGSLSIVTETHHLDFFSRELTEGLRERLRAIASARTTRVAPAATVGALRGLWMVVARHAAEVRVLFGSDATLMREAMNATDDEQRRTHAIQRRMIALWNSSFAVFLPASLALAAQLAAGPTAAVPMLLVSFFMGLVLAGRWAATLARLAGLTLLQ